MTEVARYKGAQLAQNGFPLSNMIATDADGLEFLSGGDDMPRIAEATITHYPVESDDILWSSVEADLEMQNIGDTTPAQLLLSLYGITCHGDINLIGEDVINSIPTTLTNKTVTFDLLKSACEAGLTVDSDQTTTGKIQLNLPYRTNYYENLLLNYATYNGWKRLKTVPVTGNMATRANIPILVTIPYVSNMNNDFSDIRFVDWNGNLLSYGIWSKTNGSTATFAVKLASTPATGITNYLSIWYKKSDATSQAVDLNNIYTYFDGFEDGKYTGRTSPYWNWWVNAGTASIINTGQINGNYSLKHTGPGSGGLYPPGLLISNTYSSYTLKFAFKLATQGSAAYTPYVGLFYFRYYWNTTYSTQNFLRLDTYWTGTYQVLRLVKRENTTDTEIASYNWKTSKLAVNEQHTFTIKYWSTYLEVYIDSNTTPAIHVNYSTFISQDQIGFGCLQDTQGIWDDIRFYPSIGADPTVGTVGSERQGEYGGSWTWQSILSDSLVAEDTKALFTTPTMDINAPAYITTNEYNRYVPYDSPKVQINDKSILNLGYHGLDCYDALRLKVQSLCNADYTYKIPEIRFKYEI